jgi:hypothetical protein
MLAANAAEIDWAVSMSIAEPGTGIVNMASFAARQALRAAGGLCGFISVNQPRFSADQ